jgi:hypothetical protein
MKKNLLIFIFFLVLTAIFPADNILAEEDACIPPGPIMTWQETSSSFRCQETPVYRCGNNLCGKDGGTVESGVVWSECVTVFNCWDDGCQSGCDDGHTSVISGPYGPESIGAFQDVPDYKICSAQYNSWSPVFPVLECSGTCYPAPTLKELNDVSLSPVNVVDDSGYKLPINFGWEDNVEEVVGASPNNCQVESYDFGIVDPEIRQAVTGTQLQETIDEAYKLECLLKERGDYQWKVRACRLSEAEDCGQWSEIQDFKVSSAPEPKFPYDKDWQGPEKAFNDAEEDINKLQWCEISDPDIYRETTVYQEKYYKPLSYKFLIYYSEEDLCHPQLSFGDQCLPKLIDPDLAKGEKLPPEEFDDPYHAFFTKETPYAWQVSACRDAYGFDCSEYSQLWRFETGDWVLSASLVAPNNDSQTPIGLPVLLKWVSEGANSFSYEIVGVESGETDGSNLLLDYPKLGLNKVYQWRVRPCQSYDPSDCADDPWFGPWSFRTTGQAPQLISPLENDIPIPITFEWTKVEGAKSYVFKIQGPELTKEEAVDETEFLLDYPDLKQEGLYTWQVKTCARANGQVCGVYSSPQTFKTFKLAEPTGLSPLDEGELYTYQSSYNISWQSVLGARFYQYEINFTQTDPLDPKIEECSPLVGKAVVSSPDNIVNSSIASLPLSCRGSYQWRVKACLDSKCQESGDYTAWQNFDLVAKEAPPEARSWGLVPCGRTTDDPDTLSWDETEKCQLKHIFLMFFSLIDFILWKVIPLLLVLMVLFSGVMFYFSVQMQSADPLAKVKSIWKSVGWGLLIIFFSWILISLFLQVVGYRVGIFGSWWQISL